MRLSPDSSFQLCVDGEGNPQVLSRRDGETLSGDYFGFEPESRKFVRVRLIESRRSDSDGGRSRRQRLEQWADVRHAGIARVLEVADAPDGGCYVVTEFVEGEPILDYLERNRDLPSEMAGAILLQLFDVVAYLADHPRLLSLVEIEDFSVTLENGVFPGVRLTEMAENREENPLGDHELADRWVCRFAELHEFMRAEDVRTRLGVGEMMEGDVPIDPAYRVVREEMASKPGVDAILLLKEMGGVIRRVAGLEGELGARIPGELRSLRSLGQAPSGPLQRLIFASGKLNEAIAEQFELHPMVERFAYSPFLVPAAKKDSGEEVQLYILPPERLFDEAIVERLTRKMFDTYLKSHPNGVRVRFFTCEHDYSLVVGERFAAIPLPALLARRVRFSPREALTVARQFDRVLAHFESASFPVGTWNPWQIELFFQQEDLDGAKALVASREAVGDWPAWDLKFRVEPPAEAFVGSHHSPWSYLLRRLGGKCFPALLVWLLDGDRFEWALSAGL